LLCNTGNPRLDTNIAGALANFRFNFAGTET